MNTTQYDNKHFFILNFVNDAIIPYSNSGLLKKFFGGGWGLGVGVWGFTHFQVVNYLIFREKVPEFSPQSLQGAALFEGKKV